VKLLRNYRQWKERDELYADLAFIRDFLEAQLGTRIFMSRTGYAALYATSRRLLAIGFRKTPPQSKRKQHTHPVKEDKSFKRSSNPPVRDDENMTG